MFIICAACAGVAPELLPCAGASISAPELPVAVTVNLPALPAVNVVEAALVITGSWATVTV